MNKISFKNRGQRIDGTLAIPTSGEGPFPGVLLLHGLTSSEKNYIPIAEALAENGFLALTVNVRGHGTSEGDFNHLTINDGVSDGFAAYMFLKEQESVDPKRIGLCGGSFGGAIAVMLAGEHDIKSLVLRAPATYTAEMMSMKYPEIIAVEKTIFEDIPDPRTTPCVQAVANFEGSMLVVTSEHDAIIPKKVPEAYLSVARKAARKELREMPGALHSFFNNQDLRNKFITWTLNWFTETL